eukprot:scaffold1344_cov221-Pinguiococcus_pyrenoidosus.AAC.6
MQLHGCSAQQKRQPVELRGDSGRAGDIHKRVSERGVLGVELLHHPCQVRSLGKRNRIEGYHCRDGAPHMRARKDPAAPARLASICMGPFRGVRRRAR